MESSNIDVGACIRAYRKNTKLSLKQLSDLTGIAASNLSAIELNKSSPTLSTLLKIADAFGVKVGAFLDEAIYAPAYLCKRRDTDRTGEGTVEHSRISLTGHIPLCEVQVSLLTLKNTRKPTPVGPDHKDKFLYCLRGGVNISVNDEVFALSPGDALYVVAGSRTVVHPQGPDQAELLDICAR